MGSNDLARPPPQRAAPTRRPVRAARRPTDGRPRHCPPGSNRCAPGTASARACAAGSVSLNTIPVRESPNTTRPERFTHGIPKTWSAAVGIPGRDRVDDVVVLALVPVAPFGRSIGRVERCKRRPEAGWCLAERPGSLFSVACAEEGARGGHGFAPRHSWSNAARTAASSSSVRASCKPRRKAP